MLKNQFDEMCIRDRITVAAYDPATEEPVISYEDFDHSLVKPRPRNYAVAKKEAK